MAGGVNMKVRFPGLLREPMPSGNFRYRVRVAGDPKKRVRLNVDPSHPDFSEHYHAARLGLETPAPDDVRPAVRGSLAWLVDQYLTALGEQVASGLRDHKTLKKRQGLLKRLCDEALPNDERGRRFGQMSMQIPAAELFKLRDRMSRTPAAADSMIEAVSVMYKWAADDGRKIENTAAGVRRIDKGRGGAAAWTVDEIKHFWRVHPLDTTAGLCMALFVFTTCRISDAVWLGRKQEFTLQGIRGLGWQPRKKGSKFVRIPMMPQLVEATRAQTVQGKTYLLTDYGKPFASADSLGTKFRKWCDAAGLYHLSSHGIRKAGGHILAEGGCSQYMIMSIQGHAEARTSEVYTAGVERWNLAVEGMKVIGNVEW